MRGRANAIRQAKKLAGADRLVGKSENECTNLSLIAKKLNIQIAEEKLPDNISGFLMKHNDNLRIAVNKDHAETRKRFTIAHEIGHYVLHSSETLHLDKDHVESEMFFRSDVSTPDEVEANAFAAELLMPEDKVKFCIEENQITSVEELANTFEVSLDAMRYRLTNLGYL